MADLLNTATTGLVAFQRALATTGHNISNVNTDGYSRQRAEMSTRLPQPTGNGYVGSGVKVDTVSRFYDSFVVEQLRSHTAQSSYLDTYYGLSQQVDNLLADPDAGLAPTLQNFFDAMQGLADNPSSIPARQVLLSETESLVGRFHSIEDRFSSLRDSNNKQISNLTTEINSYAENLAELNLNIVIAKGMAGGEPPNDMLDERDEMLRQLSELVPVSTVEQDDGAVNVFIGNGQPLVVRTDVQRLEIAANEYDANRYEVSLAGTGTIISDYIRGGELGGVLSFREDVLDPAYNALGRVAMGLTMSVNEQHALGLDLDNQLGGDYFEDITTVSLVNSSANTGTGSLEASMTDPTLLTTSDYVLDYDGVNYTLTRSSDDTVIATGALAAVSTAAQASEGFALSLTAGAPAAGDSYLLQPTRAASHYVDLAISDTTKIAAAGPLRSEESSLNLGDGTITAPGVTTDTNLPVVLAAGDVVLEYDSDALGVGVPGFSVTIGGAPAGSIAYDPATQSGGASYDLGTELGDPDYDGITFTLAGTSLDGDQFTISQNLDAVGDNRNALDLALLQSEPILEGGTADLQSGYGQMVSDVGSKTHQLEINSKSQEALLQETQKIRESISGVNLDEEAANLLRFQQAYQATAQVINAAQSMFDVLLDAVRR